MPSPLVGVTACLKSRDEFVFHSVGDEVCRSGRAGRRRDAAADPGDRPEARSRPLLDRIDGLMVTGSPSNVDPEPLWRPRGARGQRGRPGPRCHHAAADPPCHRARPAAAVHLPRPAGAQRRARRLPAPACPRAARPARPSLRQEQGLARTATGRPIPCGLPPGGRLQALFDGATRDRGQLPARPGYRPLRRPAGGRGAGRGRHDRGGQRSGRPRLRAGRAVAPRVAGARRIPGRAGCSRRSARPPRAGSAGRAYPKPARAVA